METPKPENNQSEPTRRSFLKNMMAGVAAFSPAISALASIPVERLSKEQLDKINPIRNSINRIMRTLDYNERTIEILGNLSEEEIREQNDFAETIEQNRKDMMLGTAGGGVAGATLGAVAGHLIEKKKESKIGEAIFGAALVGTVGTVAGMVLGSGEFKNKKGKTREELYTGKAGLEAFVDRLRKEEKPLTHDSILQEIKRLKEENEKLNKEKHARFEEHNALVREWEEKLSK
jgi:hypothetical protein